MRNRVSREKRKTDDLLNCRIIAKKKQADNRARKQKLDFEKRNEEPFYERLRRTDHEYQIKKRQQQIHTRQNRAHAASFKDGQCLLNLLKYTDYAKQDEIKANEIAEKINKRHEAELAERKDQKQIKLLATSLSNLRRM